MEQNLDQIAEQKGYKETSIEHSKCTFSLKSDKGTALLHKQHRITIEQI